MTGCTRCQSPLEAGDLRCAICALPVPVEVGGVERARSQILRCTECGAAIGFDANKQAPACGFCGALMKIEQPIDPVEVATVRLPFGVDRDAATKALRVWLGRRGFFAPRSLKDEAVFESLKPLCWAAWIVNAKADVSWSADSEAGSSRSDWAPHSGVSAIEFGSIVVPASRGLRFDECAKLVPHYDLAGAVPIGAAAGDDLVDGRDVRATGSTPAWESGLIESFDAQRSAARDHVHRAIEAVAKVRIKPEIPGQRHRNIHVSCLLQGQTTERVALPAWVLAYRFRGSPYRALVHGQDADVVLGSSPTDWIKVAMVAIAIGAIVLGIVAAVLLSRQ